MLWAHVGKPDSEARGLGSSPAGCALVCSDQTLDSHIGNASIYQGVYLLFTLLVS